MSDRIATRSYRRISVRDPHLCVYCGNPAECLDHVLPLRYSYWSRDLSPSERRLLILVPSCTDCNEIAGATTFPTFTARRAFIRTRLRKRHRKLLEAPSWTEDEIDALGRQLRDHVRGEQARRRVVLARLAWNRFREPDEESFGFYREIREKAK